MGTGEPFGVGEANNWGKKYRPQWLGDEKVFHFLHPQNTLNRYSIGQKNNFYGLIWSV